MDPQEAQIVAGKRQPRRRRNTSEMSGDNSVANNFHMVPHSYGKKRIGCIPTLPEEIMFRILLLLPAEILYNVMRYVCRLWYKIISDPTFVTAHLLQSTSGLLVQVLGRHSLQFLDVSECASKFSTLEFPFSRYILSTCDGLVLMANPWIERWTMYIANPVTNKILMLPPLSLSMEHEPLSGLAFAASSKAYKVVVLHDKAKCSTATGFDCSILTVGVDNSWRRISSENVPREVRPLNMERPIMTTGFLYWISYQPPCVLSLDIEAESIEHISLPRFSYPKHCTCYFLPKGDSVSYWRIFRDLIEVWVLKNCRTEEWVRFPDLNVKVIWPEFDRFSPMLRGPIPISWLKNGELILFRCSFTRHFFVYDVKTHDIYPFMMKPKQYASILFPYVKSLVWF